MWSLWLKEPQPPERGEWDEGPYAHGPCFAQYFARSTRAYEKDVLIIRRVVGLSLSLVSCWASWQSWSCAGGISTESIRGWS